MRRLLLLVMALAVFAAACGGATDTASTSAAEGTATTAAPAGDASESASTTAAVGDATTATEAASEGETTTAPKQVEGPAAPDFTLALGSGGGQFTLSAEQKPVFMVFWAEW